MSHSFSVCTLLSQNVIAFGDITRSPLAVDPHDQSANLLDLHQRLVTGDKLRLWKCWINLSWSAADSHLVDIDARGLLVSPIDSIMPLGEG